MAYDGSLKFDTAVDDSGFKKGLSGLQDTAKKGFGSLGKVAGKTAEVIKKSMLIGVGAIAGFATYAIKAGSDFDSAMSEVSAISGASGDALKSLEDKAKEMGATTKFSASESAEALKYMAMAGWESEKMLDGLPGVMNLAAASGEELGMVSDIVTDSMTAFGLEASQATDFADLLASTASNSNTNVAMLGESFKYVAPLAGAMGYKAEDVSVALGLMANAGVKSSQAGTSLRTALTNLASPSDKMKNAMDDLGISITDANGQMKPLDQLMVEMRGSFSDLTEEQQAHYASTIFGKNAMSGMLAVMNTSEEDFNKLTNNLNNATGAAEEMARVMNDNLQGDITLLKSAFEGVGIAMYEGMDKPAREVTQLFTGYLGDIHKAIEGNEKDIQEYMEATGATASEARAVIGEQGSLMERISETLGKILGDMAGKIAEVIPEVVNGAKALIDGFFNGLMENKDSIADAGTEIVFGLIDVIATYGGRFLELGIDVVTKMASGLAEKAPELIITIQDAILGVVNKIVENLPEFLEAGMTILENIVWGIWEMFPDLIQAGIDIILALGESISSNIRYIIEVAVELVGTFVQIIADNIDLILEVGIDILMAIIDGILNSLPELVSTAIKIMTTLIEKISEKLPLIIEAGVEIIEKLVDSLVENLDLIINGAIQIIEALVTALKDNLPMIIDSAITIVFALVDGILDNLDLIIESAIELLGVFIDAIFESADLLIDASIEIIMALIDGLVDNLDKIIEVAIKVIIALADGLIENLDKLIDGSVKIILALVDGLIENLDKIIDATIKIILALAGAIVENLPLILAKGGEIIGTLISGIAGGIGDLIAKGIELAGEFLSSLVRGFLGIFGIGKDTTNDLGDGIDSESSWLMDLVGGLASGALGVIGGVFGGILDIGKNLVTGLWDGMNGVKDWLGEKASGLANSVVDKVSGVKDKMKEAGGALVNKVGEGVDGVKNWLSDKFGGVGSNSVEKVEESKTAMENAGSDLVGKVGSGAESVSGFLFRKMKDLGSTVVDKIKGETKDSKSIGSDMVSGLWNGVNGKNGWLQGKIGGFARGIVDKTKAVLKIQSPSRVMEDEIGEMIPAGVGGGVEKGTPKLLRSIDGQINKVTDRFKKGMDFDSDISMSAKASVQRISEYDFDIGDGGKKLAMAGNVNVVSVLDGREVGRGTARFVSEEQSLALKRRG